MFITTQNLNLPDSQGLATLEAMRAAHPTVPIIVVSGSINTCLRAEALRRGAAEVVDKDEPHDRFFCKALLYIIERHSLELRRREICSLVVSSSDAILVVSAEGVARFVNPAALEMFGRPEGDVVGDLLHFSCAEPTELTILHPVRGPLIGEVRVVEVDWNGERASVVSIRDVTARRQEEELRRRSQQLEVEARVREEFLRELEAANQRLARQNEALVRAKASAEILVREVHHRVKNNLQIISSLLHLQADRVAHPETLEVFAKTSRRVDSIAKAHELLYQSNDLAHVEVGTYLRAVVDHLVSAFASSGERIAVSCEIEPVMMPIDVAISCGLIVNELVTNVFKHAFPGDRRGRLALRLRRLDDGRFELAVVDDGVGVPAAMDRRASSFGMELVETLTEQLCAELESPTGPGTCVQVRFAVPETRAASDGGDARSRASLAMTG